MEIDRKRVSQVIEENIKNAKKGRFREREVFSRAVELLPLKQIIAIVGVRRCGKSTLMKQLIRTVLKRTSENNVLYLNLEHPFFNQYKDNVSYLQEIYSVFKSNTDKNKKVFVFLDEIQFFKDWQVFIKSLYEKNEAKIVITGSNSRLLSSEMATILSGRTIPLQVYPFSLKESKKAFNDYLVSGGFPEIVLQDVPIKKMAETLYKNILYQDVIPRFNIQNTLAMENLSYYLISNPGKEISYNTLKSISHLDDKTAKQYISYLNDANLLYVISNYDYSLKKMIGNKKKVYIVDPVFTQISFKSSPDLGRLFENFIFMFLKRNERNVYFYENGSECDFIIKEGVKIKKAIQTCYKLTGENREREIRGLMAAMNKFKLDEGTIVTRDQHEVIKQDNKVINVLNRKEFMRKFGMNSEN
jgi:hypothetical protein